jgi:Protein of unknown function (DUF3024)
MSIPPNVRAEAEVLLEDFCRRHSSAVVSDQLRYGYEFEANAVVLQAQRPGFMNPDTWSTVPVAKLRYSEARQMWSLYWSDTNGRWHRLSSIPMAAEMRTLLEAIEADASGVFWGK